MTYCTAIDNQLTINLKLTPDHQAQIQARGLFPKWAEANCRSFNIPDASLMLGYKAKSAGIMLISDEYGQWQFRPDDPWFSPDGKLPKYRTPRHEYDVFLAKHPEIKAYWADLDALKARCFTIDGKPYLLITEGGFKAMMGCQFDIPTVALVGVTMGLTPRKKGEPDLVPGLKRLAEAGFGFIFAFDADALTNKNVRIAEAKLSKVLRSYGCDVRSITGHWEPGTDGETKGMDDFINKNGIEAFRAILIKSAAQSRDTGNTYPPSKSKNKQLLDLIETHWGERLRFNEMTQQVELNGKGGQLDIERVYLRLADELGIDIPKQTASDLVVVTAQKYAYSPVRDYLNSLGDVDPIDLNNLAERYFGTNDPLDAILLKRTLIAAVARAMKPGCKVDTLCILQGGQGELKSTFWQTLAGESWFTDNLSESNEKDEKLKLRRYWLLEFSEFETAYKKKQVEQLKAFLSSRIDSLRRPYGRSIEDFPRSSVFVGSTNRQEFLHDPTGERRYWVIPVTQKIPIETVEAERDQIWAAAVAAYKAGEQWWLTPDEDKLLGEKNKGWQSSDTWEASILNYLEFRSTCTIAELLEKVIDLDLSQQKKAEQMRVSDILRCNGWMKTTKRIDGRLQKCWEKVVTEVVTGVVTEVVTPQNLLSDTILDIPLPPVTTFNPKHSSEPNSDVGAEKNNYSESEKTFESPGGNTSSNNAQNSRQQGLEPVTTSHEQGGNTSSDTASQPLSNIGAKHKDIKEGDRVVITEKGNHEGQHGEVTFIGYGSRETDYTVKLDKESHFLWNVTISIPKSAILPAAYLMKL
ncbi:VapE domain-containing protein [Microcoleus sp. MON2_D5]|uniref:VapE domain-containing protein n=1 Tax=Microcoleus sp. MON2_D5 TaxID=2818833 RepID=UPI002FD10E1A